MKLVYFVLSLIGIAWLTLGNVVTIATPYDVFVAQSLERNPEGWCIEFHEDSNRLGDAEALKKALIAYIGRSGNPIYPRKNWADISVAVGTTFACLGWFREKRNEKKK